MSQPILVTPTCERDRTRFRFLRESLRFFGVNWHHLVVVDSGDDPGSYLDPADSDVEVTTVDQLLPLALARRAVRPHRRRSIRYWAGGHWRDEPRLAGWTLQQLIKLAALRRFGPVETLVLLDSDLFLLDEISPVDFQSADGTSRLFETLDTEGEMIGWELTAMDYFGIARRGNRVARHTFEPNVFDVGVGRELLEWLEQDSGSTWWEAFLASGQTEYSLYGTFARFVSRGQHLTPSPPPTLFQARNSYEGDDFALGVRAARGNAKFGMVRSALGVPVDDYEDAVRKSWVSPD